MRFLITMKYSVMIKLAGYMLVVLTTALFTVLTTAAGGLKIELNKLEDADNACRAYLLFENRTGSTFQSLKLDLVLFGQDGVITKRLAVEGGPINNGKTSVKLFEIAGLGCGNISRVLLNDVINCQDSSGKKEGCIEIVTTSSKNTVSFFK